METIDMSMCQDDDCDIIVGVVATRRGNVPFVGIRYESREVALLNARRMQACLNLSAGAGVFIERDDRDGMVVRVGDRAVPVVSMNSLSAEKFGLLTEAAKACGMLALLFGHPSEKAKIGMWIDGQVAVWMADGMILGASELEAEEAPARTAVN